MSVTPAGDTASAVYFVLFIINSASINFRLELIEPAARKVVMFCTLVEEKERVASEERIREIGSKQARLETASELKKFVDPQPL